MHLALRVVPVHRDSAVLFSLPVGGDRVVLVQDSDEVANMFFADILHSKVVHYKGEADRAPFVLPEACCDFTLVVASFVETFLQDLLGKLEIGAAGAIMPLIVTSKPKY